ncbi:hypothetical protein Tco_1327632 [Tanacetum coccineum]
MKGTCKSVVELEYHLEEVFKATNDQLDWHNPEGRPYPHDLSKPLLLIQNTLGHQVIHFDHFINNDLEYLKGGSLSKKYTTSLTKTKAADYGHVKWIEDKVPRIIWIPAQVVYEKHALLLEDRTINCTGFEKATSKDFVAKTLKICYFFLFKFSDGKLNHVRTALNDIATGIQMEYLPKRKWSKQDKQRARVMINAIDKKLRDRRLMRSLEKFVGGRPYGGDLRLLQRTI